MRRAAKVDANQQEIVDALRAAGAKVQSLASVGDGVPDLLVGYNHRLVLLEVKGSKQKRYRGMLTEAEARWHDEWEGYPVHIVRSVIDALEAVNITWDVNREL